MKQRPLPSEQRHGLRHLSDVAGLPAYAIPKLRPEPAYADVDTLHRAGGRWQPDGGRWDPAGAAWWWLARREELAGERDEHGRCELRETLTWRERAQPVVDRWAEGLLPAARRAAERKGYPLVRLARWPKDAPLAFSGTHSVDQARKWRLPTIASYLLGRGGPAKLSRWRVLGEVLRRHEPWWRFDDILEAEHEVELEATWFVTPHHRHRRDPTFSLERRRDRRQVADLRQQGQELAVHGSYRGLDTPELLEQERFEMDDVAGMRQHYLRFTVERSWPAQAQAGFRYDSSLGFPHGWGFRAGTAFPFRAWDHDRGQSLKLGELPLVAMDREVIEEPDLSRKLIDAVGGGHLNVLWHVAVFDDRDYPGYGEAYRKLLHAAHRAGAWMAPLGRVWEWWRRRGLVRVTPSERGVAVTCPHPLKGLVLHGPLEAPKGGHAVEGGVALPPLQPGRAVEIPWA